MMASAQNTPHRGHSQDGYLKPELERFERLDKATQHHGSGEAD